jgi:hypothetical protein
MSREDTAYFTPAAIFLGLGFHDAVSSVYLLLSKAGGASGTPIWRVAWIVWFLLVGFMLCQFIALDFQSVPYPVPNWWPGLIQILNYGFNLLVTIGVGVMLLMRIRVFYGKRSISYIAMVVMFLGVLVFKGLGDGYGILVSYHVMTNQYLVYTEDPLYPVRIENLTSRMLLDILDLVKLLKPHSLLLAPLASYTLSDKDLENQLNPFFLQSFLSMKDFLWSSLLG